MINSVILKTANLDEQQISPHLADFTAHCKTKYDGMRKVSDFHCMIKSIVKIQKMATLN